MAFVGEVVAAMAAAAAEVEIKEEGGGFSGSCGCKIVDVF